MLVFKKNWQVIKEYTKIDKKMYFVVICKYILIQYELKKG